jgi:hypothetical protein
MGVGLVAAIIAGVICAQGHDSDGQEFEATCGETFLTAALIAVPIGAVAGGIIGARKHGWQPVYCFGQEGQ